MQKEETPLADKDRGAEYDKSVTEKEMLAKRKAEIDKFGYVGVEQFARHENAIKDLEKALKAKPDDRKAQMDLLIEQKKLERFMKERDNAGAFKFKLLDREMLSYFEEESPGEPKKLELDAETGRLTLAESEKNRRFLFVNMGDLARFNKEGGGHAAGDAALADTSWTIERVVRDHLKDKKDKQTGYELLRFSGNEFMVNFDDISAEDLKAITEDLEKQQPGKDVPGVTEAAPLSAVSFDFAMTVDIVDRLQADLGPIERVSNASEAKSELIKSARDLANRKLDVRKFMSSVDRIRQKLSEANGEPDKEKRAEKRAKVQEYFVNYAEKTFKGTSLDSLSKFEALDSLKVEELSKQLGAMALDSSKRRLGVEKLSDNMVQDIVDTRVREIRVGRAEAGKSLLELHGPLREGEVPLAEVPDQTVGHMILLEKKKAIEAAEASGDEQAIELAKIEYDIEFAKRDAEEKPKGEGEGYGRTGLLERGEHYEALEAALENKEKVSMVFLDMGFLKYFDQRGGDDVANAALRLGAELLTRSLAESGVKGEAYRYGGDEFTVQIKGGDAEVAKFQEKLQQLKTEAGAVDVGKKGSVDGYYPTELVFNYGSADSDMAEKAFESLKEADVYTEADLADPKRVANLKAELMTVIADKSIESEKAVNRFLLLIERSRMTDRVKDDEVQYTATVRKNKELLVYSAKAIFKELDETPGEDGTPDPSAETKIQEWVSSGKDNEELQPLVEAWVERKSKQSRERVRGQKDMREQLIELHVRVWHYEQEIARLGKLGAEQADRIKQLEEQKKIVDDERKALLDVRKTLK